MPLYIKLDFDKQGNVLAYSASSAMRVDDAASLRCTAKTAKQALSMLRKHVGHLPEEKREQ